MPDGHRRFALPLPHRAPLAGDRRHATAAPPKTSKQGTMALADAVVDCALHDQGSRCGGRLDVDEALRPVDDHAEGFVWIGPHDPEPTVLHAPGDRFSLPPFAIEDAVHAHQRPKLEVIGDSLFMVLETARHLGSEERSSRAGRKIPANAYTGSRRQVLEFGLRRARRPLQALGLALTG